MKTVLLRLLLMLFGLICAAGATEIALRIVYPDGGMAAAHPAGNVTEAQASFHEDPECGYLPIVGRGEYGPEGCLPNAYDARHPKGRRVLFIGDSVTHRAKIIQGLRNLYGETGYEYWNAGVESFNTRQELVLYRRYNQQLQPDLVVLTFHNNDFSMTPVVVREKGQLKIYEPGVHINPWLFEKSYLYRWAWPRNEGQDRAAMVTQVHDSLAELKTRAVHLKVLLLPILKTADKWDANERRSRDQSIAFFQELKIAFYDLRPVLEKALQDGVAVEEKPGDSWHPSVAMGERFARELYQQDLFGQ